MAAPPTVDDVRPARCPCCDAVGAPPGRSLVIVGHGLRRRGVIGPLDHEDAAGEVVMLDLRRYRCQACGAVLVVVPRGVVRRRRYSAFAIAWALALFGLLGLSVVDVRQRVTPWRATPYTTNLAWAALVRWARAVRDRRLFPSLPAAVPKASLRQVAHRAAMALVGEAPAQQRGLGDDLRAGYGGVVISTKRMAA